MTEGSNPIHSKHMVAVVGDLHAADFLILEIGRRSDGYKTSLPGGFMDDIAVVSPEINEGLRALHQERLDRLDTEYFLPVGFDTSGPMPDDMLREMAREVHSIMGDIFLPMEMAPREIEDRMMAMLMSPAARETRELRLEYDAMMAAKNMHVDLPYFERNHSHGAPRSIRETMRRNRPSKRGRGKRK